MVVMLGFISGKLNGLFLVLILRFLTQEDKYWIYGVIGIQICLLIAL